MVDGFGLHGLVAEGAAPSKVADGCTWSEGPLWLPAEGVLRWSDIPNNRIMVFDPATGRTSVHREGVEFTNGRPCCADGSVVQCSHGAPGARGRAGRRGQHPRRRVRRPG